MAQVRNVCQFKLWKAKILNKTWRNIKYLMFDNGTEYIDLNFMKLCEQHGTKRHFTPQQNGIEEKEEQNNHLKSLVSQVECKTCK